MKHYGRDRREIGGHIQHESGDEGVVSFESFKKLNEAVTFNSLKMLSLREFKTGQYKGQATFNDEEVEVIGFRKGLLR